MQATLAEQAPTNHEDFLFGSQALSLSNARKGNVFNDFFGPSAAAAPRISMAAGSSLAIMSLLEQASKKVPDPFGFYDGQEDDKSPEAGWTKFVPRALKLKGFIDLSIAALAVATWPRFCDVPLKKFLIGMLILGFPTTKVIDWISKSGMMRQRFKYYRLTVTEGRSCEPQDAQLEKLIFLDRFGIPIEDPGMRVEQEESSWTFTLSIPWFITGYQIVTNRTAGSQQDPMSWYLEGSWDGEDDTWILLDECTGQQLPAQRNAPSARFEDLAHISDATTSFRIGFVAEIFANACSFLWLIKGTGWVSAGIENCIDTAPELWYSCYLIVVLLWSFIGTITIGLIVSAVAMIVVGNRPPR